ncbi:MAG: hypothetical protein WCL32_02320 [Planctomycetota bacterium]|jgi:hypothetical protein
MADGIQPSALEKELKDLTKTSIDSFDVKGGEGTSEKLVDAIEMIGEEQAAGLKPPPEHITAGMRYLHCSRTIHQLVTDRNRAVGIFLAVASLLVTASGALSNAHPAGPLIVPIELIQRWCLPITFAVLTVLALLMAFLLIRTRVGMIYEVAKMNALLGLPLGRVSHVNPLSIFFILQAIISLAGGFSAGIFTIFMLHWSNPETHFAGWWGALVGVIITVGLIVLYAVTVNITTSDERLRNIK